MPTAFPVNPAPITTAAYTASATTTAVSWSGSPTSAARTGHPMTATNVNAAPVRQPQLCSVATITCPA